MSIADDYKKNNHKNEGIKNKIIIILLLLCIILSILCIFLFSSSSEKANNNEVVQLGEGYYQEYLYPVLTSGMSEDERTVYLKENQEVGFRINLADLLQVYQQDLKSESNACSVEETIVYLFPKEPFGPEDVEIIIREICGK